MGDSRLSLLVSALRSVYGALFMSVDSWFSLTVSYANRRSLSSLFATMKSSVACAVLGSLMITQTACFPHDNQVSMGAHNWLNVYSDKCCEALVEEVGLFNDKQCVNIDSPGASSAETVLLATWCNATSTSGTIARAMGPSLAHHVHWR